MRLLDDGRFHHRMRQSWVNSWLTCPEQSRLILNHTYPRDETEAAAKGTAVHAAIEATLVDMAEPQDALELAYGTFREISAKPEFRWVKVKTEKTALAHIEGGFYSWLNHVQPTLGATAWVEKRFRFVFHEDDERVIELSGTADYGDRSGLRDWKLSGNQDKYGRDAWKLRRWSVQPTFYAAAAYELGLFAPDEVVPFTFVNLDVKGRAPQLASADRTPGHMVWLKHQLVSIAKQIEAQTPEAPWPLNDQHALCSAQWCLVYDQCKGQHLECSPNVGSVTPVKVGLISPAATAA